MNLYRFLADLIAAIHLAYVAFVVLGLLVILLGVVLRWQWVRNFWFRAIHLLMIGVVVAEALCGFVCPLTTWEYDLRVKAGDQGISGTFVERLVHSVMFFTAPPWVFTLCYCLFGAAVLLVFVLAPPRLPWTSRQ